MTNETYIQPNGGVNEDTLMLMSTEAFTGGGGASPHAASGGLLLSIRPDDFNALVLRAARHAVQLLGDRPDYLTTAEVAEYLGYSESRINNLCSQGRIPFYKDGGRRIFIRQEIDAWVKGLDRVTVQEAWALQP